MRKENFVNFSGFAALCAILRANNNIIAQIHTTEVASDKLGALSKKCDFCLRRLLLKIPLRGNFPAKVFCVNINHLFILLIFKTAVLSISIYVTDFKKTIIGKSKYAIEIFNFSC